MEVTFAPITELNLPQYLEVGRQSYNEHYLHLWENRDPRSYFATSFTETQVQQEVKDPNCDNFLIQYKIAYAGVLKLSKHYGWREWKDKEALYLHRIYLLREFSGKGLGKVVLEFVTTYAKRLDKKVIWLETMKKGKALNFYRANGFEIAGETVITLAGVLPAEKEMWILIKKL